MSATVFYGASRAGDQSSDVPEVVKDIATCLTLFALAMLFVSAIVSMWLEIRANLALIEARAPFQMDSRLSRTSFAAKVYMKRLSQGWNRGSAGEGDQAFKVGIRGRLQRFWLMESFVPR